MSTSNDSNAPRRIPVLVVSGFLGSGKTSLVSQLLRAAQREGLRVAVVSNELGELGVDRALLGQGKEAYVELDGGCVCCELSDDLIETLEMLHREVNPDRVIVETSGVALPYDTQLNFWRKPVSSWIGDDLAVVVVNAEQLLEGRDLEGTFEDQVSSADLLLLNKIDLVPDERLDEIETRLREIEDEAPIVRCVRGDVESELLFPPDLGEVDRSGPAPATPHHHHEHFVSHIWEPPAGIDEEGIVAALKRPALLRAKGFVSIGGEVRLIQVVGRRIEFSAVEESPPASILGRLVLIERASSD